MKYLELLGRILFSIIFLMTIRNHFSAPAVEYAISKGVPLAGILVPLSGAIAFFGALSIILGYKTRMGASLIIIFLLPVTFMMHDFWNLTDPMMRMTQRVMFLKNISMLGAAFIILYFGAGPVSLDSKNRKH